MGTGQIKCLSYATLLSQKNGAPSLFKMVQNNFEAKISQFLCFVTLSGCTFSKINLLSSWKLGKHCEVVHTYIKQNKCTHFFKVEIILCRCITYLEVMVCTVQKANSTSQLSRATPYPWNTTAIHLTKTAAIKLAAHKFPRITLTVWLNRASSCCIEMTTVRLRTMPTKAKNSDAMSYLPSSFLRINCFWKKSFSVKDFLW